MNAPHTVRQTASPAPCALRLTADGLTADGQRIDIATAVARCSAAGRVDLCITDDAPGVVYVDLATALARAGLSVAALRNGRGRKAAPHRYTREGRTILRDGVPIVDIVRVDLGNQQYAIKPHETDVLSQQIVDLLNGVPRRRQSAGDDAWSAKEATARGARERIQRDEMAKVDRRFRTARRKLDREIAAISAGDTSAEQRDLAFRARRRLEQIQQEMLAYDRDRAAELDREVSAVIEELRRAVNEDGPRARRGLLDAELAANDEALRAERIAREETYGWMRPNR